VTWRLSRFRAGDLVEVRSADEILATLDRTGAVESMPFMPEMLRYCGQRFRVRAVAHKTCETARQSLVARRLESTVHLEDLRCDGSAHGGCQAGCSLFWKDAWLRPVRRGAVAPGETSPAGLTVEGLGDLTRVDDGKGEPRYSCQATRLWDASAPLDWWNIRQYWLDVFTGNRTVGRALRVLWFAALKTAVRRTPRGSRLINALRVRSHRWLMGRDVPDFQGAIGKDEPTPVQRLDLKPGERVRVKSKDAVMQTIDVRGRNRGLYFDVEMSRHCGTVTTVQRSVTQIIDEATGAMRYMKTACIVLDGAVCDSDYSSRRLLCPRAISSYWREIWLERLDDEALRDEP
jgi:hypothetical protein